MFYFLKTLDSLLIDTLVTKVESLFQNHLLIPTHHQAILRVSSTQYWVPFLLVLIFSIFVNVCFEDFNILIEELIFLLPFKL